MAIKGAQGCVKGEVSPYMNRESQWYLTKPEGDF